MKTKNNYVVIQELPEEDITKSGIYLTPNPVMNRKAIVILAGENEDGIVTGDIVVKNLGKGTIMNINDVDYEMINISQLMAVIKNENECKDQNQKEGDLN
jgi:co-chaperonin GroES (HSP10)